MRVDMMTAIETWRRVTHVATLYRLYELTLQASLTSDASVQAGEGKDQSGREIMHGTRVALGSAPALGLGHSRS